MSDTRRPTAIDLFCGAGGMSLGFEQAGFDVIIAIDSDPLNVTTHSINFPKCRTICQDIAGLSGTELLSNWPLQLPREIDVVFGGPPCQGFSIMGSRNAEDPRNGLLIDFARLVGEVKPKYFVSENVDGLLSDYASSTLDLFKTTARGFGYEVVEPIEVFNAADHNTPQDRSRAFIVGYRSDLPRPQLPKIDVLTRSAPTVWDAIKDLSIIDRHADQVNGDCFTGRLGSPSHYAKMLRGDVIDPTDMAAVRRGPKGKLRGCKRTLHSASVRERFLNTLPGTSDHISKFHRLNKDGLSTTLRAGTRELHGSHTAARPIHPVHPRCITVREGARLHGIPDWFQFDPTIWHGFMQLGNSVPPPLAKAIAASIIAALLS